MTEAPTISEAEKVELPTPATKEDFQFLQEQIDDMQAQIDGLGKGKNVSASSAEPVESRYLYKDGDAKVFYGADIKKADKKGWLKAPAKKKSKAKD